ncbi:MAG TPA: DUF3160 domain-containing protein, partial [Kofleriaceae bacterium]|nr:DUF3160 domain-containing protein [Kofleriaceae bacterium]
MTKLSLACLAVVACGGEHKQAAPPRPPGVAAPTAASGSPDRCTPGELPDLAPSPPSEDGEQDDGQGRKTEPWEEGNTCEIADSNLARVEAAMHAGKPGSTVAAKPWNGKTTPAYGKLVARRLSLTAADKKLLGQNHFVVLGRHRFDSYGSAFHEIYQSQLPIYVSVDAVMQAIYASNEGIIADLEDAKLAPMLAEAVDNMACELPGAAAHYTKDTARDLDLYLAVARALLRGEAAHSVLGDAGVETEAQALVDKALAAAEMQPVMLFGRPRMIDFTAYTPRSHYAASPGRQQYFRAGMWLSRLEFNLVSRSSRSSQPGDIPDPRETPREAVDAMALADLVERAHAAPTIAKLDSAWALLAGRREDVSIAQLAGLRRTASIDLTAPDAATKLRTAIGDHFKRTARLHYMPEGSTELPAISTLLGPRVVPDAAATRPLVNGAIPGRMSLPAADLGYAVGQDRALDYLADELAKYPTLEAHLREARTITATAPRGTDDLYSAWLDAIVGLGQHPAGSLPSFTATPAYQDLRLDSALLAYGQLKHNFVLVVGESYFEGGCEIPDGYVEPAPAMYDALIDYAKRGERALATLDPADDLKTRAYFKRLADVLGILRSIQADELAGRALTADQRAWLSMVAETTPWTTGGPPTYTGWWFDLHRHRRDEGLATSSFIASYFTGDTIGYIGATTPSLGVFVVDTGGEPRVMVGPVGHAYEVQGGVQKRLTDAAAAQLPDAARRSPWTARYTTAAPKVPAFEITDWEGKVTVDAAGPMKIVIETFDH